MQDYGYHLQKKILYLLNIRYAMYNYIQPIIKTTKFMKKSEVFLS